MPQNAFNNAYWNEARNGIYVDIISGEPLFTSLDKYKSGTGWPSFSKPIKTDNIVENTDYLLLFPRTEVRSKYGDSHLGHVFTDGPKPTESRYCINSAALRFIPAIELQTKGYGEFADLLPAQKVLKVLKVLKVKTIRRGELMFTYLKRAHTLLNSSRRLYFTTPLLLRLYLVPIF